MLLLLLSRLSRVRLCATPETAAHQAPPSLGFSRQEHWSGLPFPSPVHESEVTQSCLTLRDPMVCSLPGSSVHGIFQARVLVISGWCLDGGMMTNIFSVFCVLFYHLQVVWVRCIALLQLEKGNAYENI